MSTADYRTATAAEVALMLDWAAEEGWNPGLEDAAPFFASDPGGFFVATVDNRPVAAISVVNHSDSFAFLGLYLCRPEYRGRGIGLGLWTHALAHAGERTVGLDGVPAQEANYARSGFVLTGRTRRLLGIVPIAEVRLPIATEEDGEVIHQLDQAANGFARPNFLKAWTTETATRKTVLLERDGQVSGFATARRCRGAGKVGPIVAPSPEEAFDLTVQAAAAAGTNEIMIDVPDTQAEFEALLGDRGFVEVFATARMYRGTPPTSAKTLRATATLELG